MSIKRKIKILSKYKNSEAFDKETQNNAFTYELTEIMMKINKLCTNVIDSINKLQFDDINTENISTKNQ